MKTIYQLEIFDLDGKFLRSIEISGSDAYLLKDIFSHVTFTDSLVTLYFNLKTNYAL